MWIAILGNGADNEGMPAYVLSGGPCHWDLSICFYVFLGPHYVKNHIGNLDTQGQLAKLTRHSRRMADRVKARFDSFFNPDIRKGQWKLYEFGVCCSYHVDLEVRLPPTGWNGLTATEVEARLPAGCGALIVDRIGSAEHPFARIGGRRVLLDEDSSASTIAHELGHILGLPDRYRTATIKKLGVKGNGMTRQEELSHRGELMGLKDRQGNRRIAAHEVQEIARITGMTCDSRVCCPPSKKKKIGAEGVADPQGTIPRQWSERSIDSVMHAPAPVVFPATGGAAVGFSMAAEVWPEKVWRNSLADIGETVELHPDGLQPDVVMRRGEGPLKQALDDRLDRPVKFCPKCAPNEYPVRVHGRLVVGDCDGITKAEEREMSDSLLAKGKRSAGVLCELNGNCPKARLVSYRIDRIACEDRLWVVDLTWFFRCEPE